MLSFCVNAPVRADLCGGTLDLWPISCQYDSPKVINVALSAYAKAYFSVADEQPWQFFVSDEKHSSLDISSMDFDESTLPPALRFPAFLVREYLKTKKSLPSKMIRMHIHTEAPTGSGLGGSSALAVAVTVGLARIFGDFMEQGWQWKLVDWVRDVESSFLKLPAGSQDHLAPVFGGLRSYDFLKGRTTNHAYSDEVLKELDSQMVIIFSGESHHSGLSNWEVFKKFFDGDEGVRKGFGDIHDLSISMHECLSRAEVDWSRVGKLMSQEWDVRRKLFGSDTKVLNGIISWISDQAILGVKVCGAAQGGSLMILVAPHQRRDFVAKCKTRGLLVLDTHAVSGGVQVVPGALKM